jgi:pantoate--beta-alanine ligase
MMDTVSSITDLRNSRSCWTLPVGFVPTMGYLHEGHLSLVRKARKDCESVVVSIFVNPAQFAHNEDLNSYPRDIAHDLELLEAQNVDLVWIPTIREMYPPGFQSWVSVEEVTLPLEGKIRPEHFRGVTTIVAKLFNCVQPDKAYFGQKDFQQTVVIRRMVNDLNIPIEVVVCPTVREEDGLALSSRNIYLNSEQRQAANVLNGSLVKARRVFESGQRDADILRAVVTDSIHEEPLAQLQYVSCADLETLVELNGIVERCLLSIAVNFGKTRLIDNLLIGD